MELELYQAENGPCPYRESGTWVSYSFEIDHLNPAFYEQLMGIGFRRSGLTFYKNNCPDCNDCIPIRIPVRNFIPSKTQRRVIKKNADLVITRSHVEFDIHVYNLYKKYIRSWHKSSSLPSAEEFYQFLIATPFETQLMKYYDCGELVGVSWIDLLPQSISSVYFAFDPDVAHRGLGTFSLLKEIELTKELNKSWLYLGFWVKDAHNMSYKAQFKPYELLVNGEWVEHR